MGVNLGQLVAKITGMAAVLGLSLFLSAGTLAWPAGWAFLLLFLGFVVALSLWLLRYKPHLLAERLTGIVIPSQKRESRILLKSWIPGRASLGRNGYFLLSCEFCKKL